MNQCMSVGEPGLQGAFAKVEEYGLSFHFTNEVVDIEGKGNEMIQYSYISLKQDALHWLRENGRLPSADIGNYFEEIRQMNESKQKLELLEQRIEILQEENVALQKKKDGEIMALQEKKNTEILELREQIELMKVSGKKTQSLLKNLSMTIGDKKSEKNSYL